MDHYKILQIEPNSTPQQIKAAYKTLARQYHPDKIAHNHVANPQSRDEVDAVKSDRNVTDMFTVVSASYEVLSDPLKRAKYDYEMGYLTTSADIQRLHKVDAEKAVDLMRLTFDIKRRTEFSRQGLIIDDAYYGSPLHADKRVNVTRPLQCMVQGSRLVIPKGDPKYLLIGFYDPCPGEEKVLCIRYYFRGKLHETTRHDTDKVLMPLKSHLLRRGQHTQTSVAKSSNHVRGALYVSAACLLAGAVVAGVWKWKQANNVRARQPSSDIAILIE